MDKERHEKEGEHADKKADNTKRNYLVTAGRLRLNMSGTVLTISTLVFGVLLTISFVYWQKGGYENAKIGFYWLIFACAAFTVSVLSAYWYNIIKPVRDAKERPQASVERPELFVEQVIIEPFQTEKPETVSLIFRNRGKAVAENITIETTHAHQSKTFDGPLVYETKPPESILTVGPDAVFTMVSRSPWTASANDIQEIVNGNRLLFVYGKGNYEDREGAEYPISFCFMYEPSLPRNMVICPTRFLPSDKPKPEVTETLKEETPEQEPPTQGEPKPVLGYGSGAPSQKLWPSLPPPTPYDHIRWTNYREDYFYGAIWRWTYRPEMGDKEPRNIFGYCPECNRPLQTDITSNKRKPDDLFVFAFHCGRHVNKTYWVRSPTRDPIDAIRGQIREKIQSEAWRDVVKKQIDAREGRT